VSSRRKRNFRFATTTTTKSITNKKGGRSSKPPSDVSILGFQATSMKNIGRCFL